MPRPLRSRRGLGTHDDVSRNGRCLVVFTGPFLWITNALPKGAQ